MDELEISGKRYISTRRAAKENKYHSDYIGQLIRGGKVIGQKVGRAWYVEVESFNDYLGKEGAVEHTNSAPVEQVAQELPSPVLVEEEIIQENSSVEEKPVQEVQEENSRVEEDVHVISITRDKGTADNKHVHGRGKSAGLRYYADDGPLYPRTQYAPAPVFFATQNEKVLEESQPVIHSSRPIRARKTWRLSHTFALAGIGALTLFCVAVISSALYSEVKVNNQTASISYGFDFSYPTSFIQSVK